MQRVSDNIICLVFFFQAEDGIRDLVRSRGLGDVYKRQVIVMLEMTLVKPRTGKNDRKPEPAGENVNVGSEEYPDPTSVSYTHLTLPTSDLV